MIELDVEDTAGITVDPAGGIAGAPVRVQCLDVSHLSDGPRISQLNEIFAIHFCRADHGVGMRFAKAALLGLPVTTAGLYARGQKPDRTDRDGDIILQILLDLFEGLFRIWCIGS